MQGKEIKNEAAKKKISKSSLKKAKRFLPYLRPNIIPFAIGFFFLLITGATALLFPKLMGNMIDAATATTDDINKVAITLFVVFIIQSIASFFRIYLFAIVTEKAIALLRLDVYGHLIKMPMSFYSTQRVGELNSRISSDISTLQETFTTTIAEFLRQLIIIIGGVFLLSSISLKLTGFMLLLIPVIALSAVFFGKFIRKLSKATQDKIAASNTIVEETFAGITNVKAFTNEFFEISRYNTTIKEVVELALKGAKWRGAFASFIIFCLFGSIVAVVWYGTILVNQPNSGLSIGSLIEFILYTVFMGASIGGIAAQYAQIQRAVGATENLFDLMDEETEAITKPSKNVKLSGTVKFDAISFSYPSRSDIQVLNEVSFDIKKGQQVAIVGGSGAGKSTITALLMKFYAISEGTILIDGKNINDYALSDLRSQMAVVPQDVILFGGTIKENIVYGKPDATYDEIVAAAEKANALEFINSFPDKFDTVVGERGIQLSGGQRQRIAIARAVLKDPVILILDEATSSLDSESERIVQDALEKLMQNRTSVVIAHRLSTIRNAHKILVLDNGVITENGTHEELLQIENGIYRKLSNLQNENIHIQL